MTPVLTQFRYMLSYFASFYPVVLWIPRLIFLKSFLKFLIIKVYLFWERASVGGSERESEPSRLHTIGAVGSWPETKSRTGCSTDWATQAPLFLFILRARAQVEGRADRIPSRLCAVSVEPDTGLDPTNWNHDLSWNQVRCSTNWATQGPDFFFFNWKSFLLDLYFLPSYCHFVSFLCRVPFSISCNRGLVVMNVSFCLWNSFSYFQC